MQKYKKELEKINDAKRISTNTKNKIKKNI